MQQQNAKAESGKDKGKVYIAFVYGSSEKTERWDLWQYLKRLSSSMQEPWFVGGDFNSLMSENERIGGDPVTCTNMEDFITCGDNYHLQEANYMGSVFTWNNKQVNTKEFSRLHRILLNEEAVRLLNQPLRKMNAEGFGDVHQKEFRRACNTDYCSLKVSRKVHHYYLKTQHSGNVNPLQNVVGIGGKSCI
ncbi:hypothetical protein Cgig2_018576 [Carnegiea gigantea]|uniref:Uncharacterized protein n=1 Tax=Carnegiea gigantea TaxID=171969 RepID=A0A9Q1QML2_9CARY|nr:hypothetical protein Cgig2_018576 [Carnegiea gigantea]